MLTVNEITPVTLYLKSISIKHHTVSTHKKHKKGEVFTMPYNDIVSVALTIQIYL